MSRTYRSEFNYACARAKLCNTCKYQSHERLKRVRGSTRIHIACGSGGEIREAPISDLTDACLAMPFWQRSCLSVAIYTDFLFACMCAGGDCFEDERIKGYKLYGIVICRVIKKWKD